MRGDSPRLACLLGLALIAGAPPASAAPDGRTLVGLRGRNEPALRALLAAQQAPSSAEYHRWLTPREFGRRFGAAPRDLRRVTRWLRDGGCRIKRPAGRQQIECVRGRPGPLPSGLAPVIDDVIDLRQPVELRHHLAAAALRPKSQLPSGELFFTPREYAGFYGFAGLHASGITGAGERIGIVSTVPIDPGDIALFRDHYGLPPLDLEQIGAPGSNVGEDDLVEALLDVTWSGAVAPGAAVLVAVSGGTLLDAITALVNRADVSVMSLSVVLVPSRRTRPLIRQSLRLFKQAAAQGQTVLIASGDDGPLVVAAPKLRRGVDPFARSPFVTGVGGTTPSSTSPADASSYGSEVVWQDGAMASGGGRSTLRRPVWQKGLHDSRRTVPDVALAASAVYPIPMNGAITCCVAGTSAAAPAWAGVVAMRNQQRGTRAGLLNPALYALGKAQAEGGAAVFHDIVRGSNSITMARGFPAKPGYDLATGWGSPDGEALFAAWP
jgi:subtilase family serine protease